VRGRHQPDFEWQAERESYTVKPAEEYAEVCDQPSLAARGVRCGTRDAIGTGRDGDRG
jgi:hypothetical protein